VGSLLVDGIITGILTGGIYALMASGLTLVFGVMDIINVAQGALVVLGAYLTYVMVQYVHWNLFASLVLTMPAMFLLGVFIRPLKVERTAFSILVTFGIALIIEGILGTIFGTGFVLIHSPYQNETFSVLGLNISDSYVSGFVLSALLLAALYALLYLSDFGRALRATVQNRTAALLIGIDVERVSAVTFGIGVALAAAGGMAFGTLQAFEPVSSYDLISRLLVIIVLAGMGSLGGALLSSIIMLTIVNVVSLLWSPIWGNVTFFCILIVVLALRPQGLFGRLEVRRQ
jgi:branched-chain amino acid transport system permease protein